MKPTLLFILTCLLLVSCKPSEERRPLSSNSGSFIDSSIERNKQLNNREYAQIENYIQDSKKSFQSSEYGFWYAYNTQIETLKQTPEFGDLVHFDYVLKTLQDQVIYPNKKKETQLYYVDQQELFSGLREGLKLMKEGESITFIFPSQKAYGYYGDENKIGRNVPLICEVSLLKLTNN
ncbi:MAG: gliding motility-associated peptidyl-prolyl isomerase GldI [Flavobacteriaceae bacterium]|jgi:gliding motility-associated peptidyl-prolyl isomerase|nr:gliding motility-associated peptidyl-prolyl isomerase GldI [Formosa sp.]MDG1374922.1 gliding motility-associated peptidyl-prolyl isomerase GldI [Flavobacteriaceae bacterium]MDG2499475.1 gliding motility-associated peptidyl-prolyl isomerase GldI [Flavobacteriaceae bacterium]